MRQQQTKKEKKKVSAERGTGVICPACGTDNALHAKYCEECGQLLETPSTCPACRATVEIGSAVCDACGAWVDVSKCRFCGGGINQGEKICPECGTPIAGVPCPKCGTSCKSEFCEQCGSPVTPAAAKVAQQASALKEKDEVAKLQRDVEALRSRTMRHDEPAAIADDRASAQRKKEQLRFLQDTLAEAKAGMNRAPDATRSKPRPLLFTKEESELIQSKAELQRKMEEQSKKRFETVQEARRYFRAVKPPNSLGWVCNYKNTIHPSPDGCAHPELGGHWQLFTDLEWIPAENDI